MAKNIHSYLNDLLTLKHTVDINIALIGIRGLINATESAEIKISLTNHVGTKSNTKYNPTENCKKDKRKGKVVDSEDEGDEKAIKML